MTAHSNSGSGGSSFLGKVFSNLIEYTFKFLKWFFGELIPKLLQFLWIKSSQLSNYFFRIYESSYGPVLNPKRDFLIKIISFFIFIKIFIILVILMKSF